MNTLFAESPAIAVWSGSAEFEDTPIGRLRTRLDRWRADGPRALICMANPSYAGAEENDPTIRRIMALLPPGIAGFTVVNWEPFIATDPHDLYLWRDRYGGSEAYRDIESRNLRRMRILSDSAAQHFIAWGNLVPRTPHTQHVLLAMSHDLQYPLYAFGLTKDGSPKHPMARGRHRILDGTAPVIWREARKGQS